MRFEFGAGRQKSAVTQQWSEIWSETTSFSTSHCLMSCSSKTFRKWVSAVWDGAAFHSGCLALKSSRRKVGKLVACSSHSERRVKKVRGEGSGDGNSRKERKCQRCVHGILVKCIQCLWTCVRVRSRQASEVRVYVHQHLGLYMYVRSRRKSVWPTRSEVGGEFCEVGCG